MTGAVPGSGDDVPQPWDGRPPRESPYYASYDRQEPEQPPWSEPVPPTPVDGPNRRVVAALVAATVVVVVGGVAVWWFAAGPGHNATPRPVAATRGNPPPPGAAGTRAVDVGATGRRPTTSARASPRCRVRGRAGSS